MPVGLTRPLAWLLPLATAGAALAWSNPGPAEFEAFAAERLTALISAEVCQSNDLPLAMHLLLRNCPALVSSQSALLGRLAGQATQRTNAGLFSLYSTELGGQAVLPGLRLPRVHALTLAGAGQLVLLQARADDGPQEP